MWKPAQPAATWEYINKSQESKICGSVNLLSLISTFVLNKIQSRLTMALIKVWTKYAAGVFKLMEVVQVHSCSLLIPVDVPVQDTNKVPSQGVSKVAHVG